MICICCLLEFEEEDLIFMYSIVNAKKPEQKPKPHSGLCFECHKNPYKYPQAIN